MKKKFIQVKDAKPGKSMSNDEIKRVQKRMATNNDDPLSTKFVGWLAVKFIKLIVLIVCLPYKLYKYITNKKQTQVDPKVKSKETSKETLKKPNKK